MCGEIYTTENELGTQCNRQTVRRLRDQSKEKKVWRQTEYCLFVRL